MMPIRIVRHTAPPKVVPIVQGVRMSDPLMDGMALTVMKTSPNGAIPWWLIANYLLDHQRVRILSKRLMQEMAAAMLEAWDELEHVHKPLITEDDLRACSMSRMAAHDYPGSVRGAALHLVRDKFQDLKE